MVGMDGVVYGLVIRECLRHLEKARPYFSLSSCVDGGGEWNSPFLNQNRELVSEFREQSVDQTWGSVNRHAVR